MKRVMVCTLAVLGLEILSRNGLTEPSWPTTTQFLLEKSVFNPVITVPLVEKTPTIDGTVNDEEWANASLIPDLIADAGENAKGGGLPLEYRVRYWIQYDNEALYFAARFDVPEWSAPPQVYGTVHDVAGREDAVDIFLDPKGSWNWYGDYHIGGNAAGNPYDRNNMDAAVLWRWNPKWDYKARIFPGGWEAEMRIAFKEFDGAPTPKPGDKWRANLYSVRQVPMFGVSCWAYLQTWRAHNEHEGWLVFSGEPLAARFDHGANVAGSKGIHFSLAGKKPAEPIKAEFQMYKREGMPTPDDPGQMVTIGTLVDNIKKGGSDSYGLSYEAALALGMTPLKKIETPIQRTQSASGLESVVIKPTELGEYLLDYKVTKGEGDKRTILAAGVLPFRVKPPVDLQVKPRIMLQDKVEFETSLTGLEDPSKAKKLSLKVTADKGGKAVFEKTVDVQGVRVVIDAPMKVLPPGKYTARVDVSGANGEKVGDSIKEFPIAAIPDWRLKPAGMKPLVPEPWTPVKWKNNTAEVWGRKYKFDGLPVPAAISATPDPLSDAAPMGDPIPILASPMELNAKVGGKSLTWKRERFEVANQTPERVVVESVNSAAGIVLKGKTTVEFDGMIRVDLEVTGKVESLDLVMPLRTEVAEFLSNYRKAPGPGKIPDRYIGRLPKERWTFPIFYTQWIGNNKVGLEWFCDSMKGWRLTGKKADEATEVVRDGNRVLEIYHLVEHEAKPDAPPLAITFGLLATPTKPARRGWDIYRTEELISFPPTIGKLAPKSADRIASQEDVDAWKRRAEYGGAKFNTAFWPQWTGVAYFSYRVDHDPEVEKDIRWKFKIAKEVGMKVGPYSCWAMSTKIPEWDLWGPEMIKMPYEGSLYQTVYGCYNSPYSDFFLGNFVKNVELVGLDGMRHDTIAPQPACESEVHGCAWKDEHGKTWGSVNLFATREFFKRAYRETHGGAVKDGFITFPVAGPPINSLDAFVDVHHIGEGNFERAHSLKEGYPQDQVRVRMVGTQYGYVSQNNLKGHPIHPNERVAALLVAGGDPRLMGSGLASSYFRGYQNSGGANPNVREVWEAWRWIDRGRASLWRPYWENADTLTLTPPSLANGAKPEIYGSFYYITGKKILFIVTNYEQVPLENVEARFDLVKLGFKAGDNLFAEDAVTSEPIEVKDGAIKVGILPERYRMVKISRDTPRYNAGRLGSNLLAAGTFEAFPEGFQITAPLTEQGQPFAAKDDKVFRSGASSLRLTKVGTDLKAGQVYSLPCPVTKGRYLLSGYIRLDANLTPPREGANPRPDYNHVTVLINGSNIISDPPREFSMWGGSYPIGEATPGWEKFMIPFDAAEDTKNVSIQLVQFGAGTAWLDDVQIQKVAEEGLHASNSIVPANNGSPNRTRQDQEFLSPLTCQTRADLLERSSEDRPGFMDQRFERGRKAGP